MCSKSTITTGNYFDEDVVVSQSKVSTLSK